MMQIHNNIKIDVKIYHDCFVPFLDLVTINENWTWEEQMFWLNMVHSKQQCVIFYK